MYVCTFALPDLNWLIRVEVDELEGNVMATYRRTDGHGAEDSFSCPIGPDTYDVGYPTVAVVSMIRDLNFAGIEGHIHVTHYGILNQDDLLDVLQQVRPGYVMLNSMATGTLQ